MFIYPPPTFVDGGIRKQLTLAFEGASGFSVFSFMSQAGTLENAPLYDCCGFVKSFLAIQGVI